MPAASVSSRLRFRHRKHLLERYLPLTQAHADHGDVALVIDPDDAAGLVEARHMDRIVGLQSGAGLAESRCGLGFALESSRFILELLPLPFRLVLGTQGPRAGLFGFFPLLLQLDTLPTTPCPP